MFSLSSVQVPSVAEIPTIHYNDPMTVTVIGSSGSAVCRWWEEVQSHPPFSRLQALPHCEDSNAILLTLKPEATQQQERISELFWKARMVVTPKILYESRTEALAVSSDRPSLMLWWQSVKSRPPFNRVVADRVGDRQDACRLRLGLGYVNEQQRISQVFQEAHIPVDGKPSDDLPGVAPVQSLLSHLDRRYTIEGSEYQIRGLISDRGSYGDVFLAHDCTYDREVAIKILRVEQDEEASVLRRMRDAGGHPHIVQFFGSATIMGKTWIAMEYIQGEMLSLYLKHSPYTSEMRAQYDDAISFMTRCVIRGVERENNGENIIVTFSEGKPWLKLIDFGTLARS